MPVLVSFIIHTTSEITSFSSVLRATNLFKKEKVVVEHF